jgi:peptide/nickel transport system substrate-binding protein
MGASGSGPSDRPEPRDLDPSAEPHTPTAESPLSGASGPIEEVLAEPEVKAPAEAELRTFLIADIRGYTVYTTEHGADAAAALATRFAAIVREVVTANEGFLIELRGDEALAVFVLARRALRAALELQTRFAAELPRGVGIGLDAGEAIPVEGGYRGSALNLAARLCGQAGPGETLASEAVIHLAAKVDGIGYADPRTYRLKGMDEPIRAVHVVSADKASKKPIRYGGDGMRSDRRLLAVLGAGFVALAIIALAMSGVFNRGGSAGASPSLGPAAAASPASSPELFATDDLPLMAWVDPETGAVTDPIGTDSQVVVGEFVDGSIWLLGEDPWVVYQVDPVSHRTLKTVSISVAMPSGYWVDNGTLWVTDIGAPRVIGVDVATGIQEHDYWLTESKDDRPGAFSLAVGAGSLWVGLPDAEEVIRVDPETGKVQARIPLRWPDALAFDETGVYATGDGKLHRIDPATNEVTWATPIADAYLGVIAFGGGFTWTVDDSSGTVWKVNRAGQVTGSYQVGVGALPLAPLGDTMWVGVQDLGKLVGIDMVTGATREIVLGHLLYGLVATPTELLATLGPTPEEIIAGIEGDTLTIASPYAPFFSPNPDPATNGSFEFRQAAYFTCAGLLRYPNKPAPDGWVLEPEVAAAMPEVSADGRTYTFTVRDGFVFSPPSNEKVTAATFRATLERALAADLGESGRGIMFLADIQGAVDYHEDRTAHVSGIVADGDRLTITLEAPAPDFLRRLTLPYFCPLPLGTPTVPRGLDPIPPLAAAGPYYLAKHIAAELGLYLPNPNYTGPRERPWAAIAFRFGFVPGDAIGRVEAGLADAAVSGAFEPLLNAASERAKEWGPGSPAAAGGDQRWFGGPRFLTDYIAMNPADPLLKDPAVRRAIALALDRSTLAAVFGEAPTASLLAPSVPGSPPADTAPPTPDRDTARVLLAGRTGTLVMASPPAGECPECDAIASAVKSQLAPMGITVQIKEFDDPWAASQEPKNKIDLLNGSLDTDYPDPVALMGRLRVNAWLPKADLAELDRIGGLEGQARIDAAAALAARVADDGTWVVPFGYPVYPLFLGKTVGCGYVQPAIGAVDLLSLCRKP